MLVENWRSILKRAWSIRLIILAGLLSGLEVILPLFVDAFPVGLFASLSFVTTVGAFGARIIAQQDIEG